MRSVSWTSLTLLCLFLGIASLYLPITLATAQGGKTERVSVNSQGLQGNGDSGYPRPILSGDGRYAFFASHASNLVPTDPNNGSDAFIHDLTSGETFIVGRGAADFRYAYTTPDDISRDGTSFLFTTYGGGVVPSDTNSSSDIFVWEMENGEVELISKDNNGNALGFAGRSKMSGDGSIVVYLYGPIYSAQVYLHNRTTNITLQASLATDGTPANQGGLNVDIAEDGSFIVFDSKATNLATTDTNSFSDIYYRDLGTGEVQLLSGSHTGGASNGNSTTPLISANGRYVAFYSEAQNLVPDDLNGSADIFVYDVQNDTLEIVSLASDGTQGDNGALEELAISADGRYVGFASRATNLVANDLNFNPDIFVHDRQTGQTRRVSVATDGGNANGESFGVALSDDGLSVLFGSTASNLITLDNNNARDMFVRVEAPSDAPNQLYLPMVYGRVASEE